MRDLINAQTENTQEMTKALTDKFSEQKTEIQELNGKVDSLDQKMGMLVELFMKQTSLQEESLKLQKQQL